MDEQRELIVDLKTKLGVVEQELELITKTTESEVAQLHRENRRMQGIISGNNLDEVAPADQLSSQQIRILMAK